MSYDPFQLIVSLDGQVAAAEQDSSPYNLLTSTVAYLGGKPRDYVLPNKLTGDNFVGCIKDVSWTFLGFLQMGRILAIASSALVQNESIDSSRIDQAIIDEAADAAGASRPMRIDR